MRDNKENLPGTVGEDTSAISLGGLRSHLAEGGKMGETGHSLTHSKTLGTRHR